MDATLHAEGFDMWYQALLFLSVRSSTPFLHTFFYIVIFTILPFSVVCCWAVFGSSSNGIAIGGIIAFRWFKVNLSSKLSSNNLLNTKTCVSLVV